MLSLSLLSPSLSLSLPSPSMSSLSLLSPSMLSLSLLSPSLSLPLSLSGSCRCCFGSFVCSDQNVHSQSLIVMMSLQPPWPRSGTVMHSQKIMALRQSGSTINNRCIYICLDVVKPTRNKHDDLCPTQSSVAALGLRWLAAAAVTALSECCSRSSLTNVIR